MTIFHKVYALIMLENVEDLGTTSCTFRQPLREFVTTKTVVYLLNILSCLVSK